MPLKPTVLVVYHPAHREFRAANAWSVSGLPARLRLGPVQLGPKPDPFAAAFGIRENVRIIYLYQYFATPRMTGGTFPYELARWLVRRGHAVHVVTAERTSEGSEWFHTDEEGIQVHWCRVSYSNHMSYGQRIRSFLRFAWEAGRKAATLPGDVIYAGSPPLTIALPAAYAARKKSIPMVFEVCDQWPATAIAVGAIHQPMIAAARWLERFAYRNSSHVVALSPDTKAGIVATGHPEDRVAMIPNRVNLATFDVEERLGHEFRRRRPWLGDRPLVVYTGAFGLVNGCDYLARLAAEVRCLAPKVRFLLVGSGREEQKIRRTAAELGVLDQTFFLEPPVPVNRIPAILSAADLAASTVIDRKALWACSPSKLVDALAAGRPIVINHEGWLADLIRGTGCGLVLDAHDLESSARRLVEALADPIWTQRARAAAARVAHQRFDHRKLFVQLESILESVVPQTLPKKAA
jgi:glycosyltransferase involved in cell wall biosynthesis